MASAYTLYFSDSRKSNITVPGVGVGPGKNNYDTSLELIGPGYVNYGPAIAQNFLKLLENFSSPVPPQNPIEGQLWYDTSDATRKVLRIHNASPTSRGWPTASGVYQQSRDPSDGIDSLDEITTVKDGDLWVNLSTGQLNVRVGGKWTVVGPTTSVSGSQKTGIEVTTVTSSQGSVFPIIQKYVGGDIVEIISNSDFTPRTVINGFSTIRAGSNLSSQNNIKYNGTAERALSLEISRGNVIRASEILRNRATTQIHTGTLVVESSNGLQVRNSSFNYAIQMANNQQGAFLNFNDSASSFRVGINSNSYIRFNGQYGNLGINTSTTSLSPTVDVNGSGRFKGLLTAENSGTTALSVIGNEVIHGTLTVSSTTVFSSQVSVSNKVTVGTTSPGVIIEPAQSDINDIGSSTKRFRRIYATIIGDNSSTVYGTLVGTAERLQSPRQISITGHVSADSQTFDGSANVNFQTSLTPAAITSSPTTSTTVASQTFLIVNTATVTPVLQKISKSTFLSDVYPGLISSGMIIPTGISNPSALPGYLLCNGNSYNQVTYPALFGAIGVTYGDNGPGTFRVPNLINVTIAGNGSPVYYYIKT